MHIIQPPLFDFEAFIVLEKQERLSIVLEALDAMCLPSLKTHVSREACWLHGNAPTGSGTISLADDDDTFAIVNNRRLGI